MEPTLHKKGDTPYFDQSKGEDAPKQKPLT